MIELDVEALEVFDVRALHVGDHLLFGAALGAGAERDGGAVGVVGAEVDALVAAHALRPREDVGHDVLDQVADVDVPVGVRQRARDEDA